MSEVKSMKYFIVGYMASGKSTFGKELAKDKGLPFLDLDERVESREEPVDFGDFCQGGRGVFPEEGTGDLA